MLEIWLTVKRIKFMFGVYLSFFLVSTIKFLFAPFGGPAAGLSFIETYLSCCAGAIFSATVFYFASEYFLKRAHDKHQKNLAENKVSIKKKFTKTNKKIVNLKRKIGIIGVSVFAPLFLSVPLGCIITAKFYGKEKKTFFLILAGIFFNGLLTTGLAFFGASLFRLFA